VPEGGEPQGDVANTEILGKWKRVSDGKYAQDLAEFRAGGSCDFSEGTKKLACRWSGLSDGQVEVHLGSLLPAVTVRGTITGDEMFLDHGDRTGSSWIREGSPLDRNSTDYAAGLARIQSGDVRGGMALWERAAERGHHGSQNSLAWIYAADRDPALHDSGKALAYAEKAVASRRHPLYLDTYAAALARAGQFAKAAEIEQEAIAILEKGEVLPQAEREAALGRFRKRLALYQAGQAFADP